MDQSQRQQLESDGYLLLRGVLSADQVSHLAARLDELWAAEGPRAGEENYVEPNAQRLANLVNKGDVFRQVFRHSAILEVVKAVIGPDVRLSMLNARAIPPHSDPSQPLHTDADHSGMPDAKGAYVCTAIWMVDDFTRANGATRLIPGTHRGSQSPKEALADVYAPHPAEVIVEGKAGDVLVFNGHCWHAGRANTTAAPRRAILVHYTRADHPQRLVQKNALSREAQDSMAPIEREILGLDD